jgi:hypothetical protein
MAVEPHNFELHKNVDCKAVELLKSLHGGRASIVCCLHDVRLGEESSAKEVGIDFGAYQGPQRR